MTRAVEVRLPIANEDYAVKPGLFARAEIYPDPRVVLALERSTLMGTEAARYVYVNDNGRAKRADVTVRQSDATRVEGLSGLKEGDKALAGPNAVLLVEGTLVRIEADPSAPQTIAKGMPANAATSAQ